MNKIKGEVCVLSQIKGEVGCVLNRASHLENSVRSGGMTRDS